MSWKKALIPLAALPLIGLLAYGFTTDPRAIPSPLIKKPAPPFTMTVYDGGPLSLEGLRGKVVLLNFWASWCFPACYEEAPELERAWRAYRDRGLVVVGVDIQDTEAAGRQFIDQFKLTFANGPDPGGKIAIDYGVYGVPETFVIDRQGVIAHKQVGGVTDQMVAEQVEPLLKP
ncbi:MAG TPA: TlpA disulfide reductase family protein [Candidatus Sulfotelmatobacter sp.]|nr:TlpA disulfide reductase family protein [Candidatus Sulfotelmatobacter sp.]